MLEQLLYAKKTRVLCKIDNQIRMLVSTNYSIGCDEIHSGRCGDKSQMNGDAGSILSAAEWILAVTVMEANSLV